MAIATNNLTNTTGIQLKDAFIIIVKTAWNKHVIDILEAGCIKILEENKVRYQVLEVPGAFEIPFAIKKYWDVFGEGENNFFDDDIDEDFFNPDKDANDIFNTSKVPNAFIALGCVIKGDTPHFDYVCQGVTHGIMQLNITLPVPVIYGVLTVNNQTQADDRLGGPHGHKGEEAAAAAIQMIALSQSFNTF